MVVPAAGLVTQKAMNLLGLTPGFDAQELRGRYRSLAREYHPDRGGDGDRMRDVNEAQHRLRQKLNK